LRSLICSFRAVSLLLSFMIAVIWFDMGRLIVAIVFLTKRQKFISLICQRKIKLHRYYLQRFTKVILTYYAIATSPAYPGIVGKVPCVFLW
jgi:hypothetical protein